MKNIYSKIAISFTIIFLILYLCAPVFAKKRINTQIGAYAGPLLFQDVSDAKGTLEGQASDTNISNVKIDQNLVWGFNGRYYWDSSRFGSTRARIDTGIDTNIAFSSIEIARNQAEIEIDMISFSLGPIFRYQERSGKRETFNPYICPVISLHYGQYGSSSVHGKGYGLKLGTEYLVDKNYGFILEACYSDDDLVLSTFDGFENGMSLRTKGGYIVIGTMWNF
jgi:hypothetical protein